MKRHTTLLAAAVAVAGLSVVVSGAMTDQLMAQETPEGPGLSFEDAGPDRAHKHRRGSRGPLTRDQAVEDAMERFSRHDADGNGEVSVEEMTAVAQARAAEFAARGFDRRDSNDDGVITSWEMEAQVIAHFDRLDADKDGVITDDERREARAALRSVSGRPHR